MSETGWGILAIAVLGTLFTVMWRVSGPEVACGFAFASLWVAISRLRKD